MTRNALRLRRVEKGGQLRPYIGQPGYETGVEFTGILRADVNITVPDLSAGETYLITDSIDYTTALLTFLPTDVPPQPTTPVGWTAWDMLSIVRSQSGFPLTNLDGTEVARYDYTVAGKATSTTMDRISLYDRNLIPNEWFYYALFARYGFIGTPVWVRVALSDLLMPADFAHRELIWERIPEYYRVLDAGVTGAYTEHSLLRKFVERIGYELDIQRTWALTIGDIWNASQISSRILDQLGMQFGLPYEQAIGEKRYRNLLANITYLRSTKGTADGIAGYLGALTGYRCTVYEGMNLMLSNDDAEMRNGIGNWSAGSASHTVSRTISPVGGETNGPPAGKGYLTITNGVAAGVTVVSSGPVVYSRNTAVPVVAGHTYQLTYAIKSSVATTTMLPVVRWYKEDDTLISTTGFTGAAQSTAVGWGAARSSAGTIIAPPFARFAVIVMVTNSIAAGVTIGLYNIMFVDKAWRPTGIAAKQTVAPLSGAAGYTTYDQLSYYESARKVWINLYPQRSNLALNANFSLDNQPAEAWSNADLTNMYALVPVAYKTYASKATADLPNLLDNETSYADLLSGLNTLLHKSTVAFDIANHQAVLSNANIAAPWFAQLSSGFFPINNITAYSARIEAKSNVAGTECKLRIRWYYDTTTGIEVLMPDGKDSSTVSGAFPLDTVEFRTCTVANAQPPEGAVYGRMMVETTNNTMNHIERFMHVLIEDQPTPGPWFDGSSTDGALKDFQFVGADNLTVSTYYMNRQAMLWGNGSERVATVLPELIPNDRDYIIITDKALFG